MPVFIAGTIQNFPPSSPRVKIAKLTRLILTAKALFCIFFHKKKKKKRLLARLEGMTLASVVPRSSHHNQTGAAR